MAGIEQIVVHSKSYVVRWISVPDFNSINWSLQPHKKSINFGIFKHPGTKNDLPTSGSEESQSQPPTPALDGAEDKRGRKVSLSTNSAVEKLESIGLKSVAWSGRCEADRVSMGVYDVKEGEGGMYGLVFDNTFSITTSKTVHFVLMTHPTNAPPKSGHHLHYAQAFSGGGTPGSKPSPQLGPVNDSSDSLPQASVTHRGVLEDPRTIGKGGRATETKGAEGATFYTGVLNKKRRKKGQGYAKRFFSLDFTSSTLSYYQNRHSSALRGAIPLSLAAVGLNEKNREFSIDSGAEVWLLKASNKKDFEGWREALEKASATSPSAPGTPGQSLTGGTAARPLDAADERQWQRVEELISKVSGARDAIRGLAKDTDPNGAAESAPPAQSRSSSTARTPSGYATPNSYFPEVGEDKSQEKRPFWKRKPSTERSPAALARRSASGQLSVPSGGQTPASPSLGAIAVSKRPSLPRLLSQPEGDLNVHERCVAILGDLDNAVSGFAALLAENKARRAPTVTSKSRLSLDSVDGREEFFDAHDGTGDTSALFNITTRGEDEDANEEREEDDQASDADSDGESDDESGPDLSEAPQPEQDSLFPSKPKSLPPLPFDNVKRRTSVTPPTQTAPSIVSFLRKNAGKDLSTVSMPVTANEPTSGLQRLAESMEYAQTLDQAAAAEDASERLMHVAAFAISYYSSNRVKERAIRKPFNPMLGETYELVREDLGFRFIAEKVSHHPVRMACQAESLTNGGWTFTQTAQPVQKFWGKSVELNTEGRARVVLHQHGEHYSWTQATCFLRNVIAGEKYVEPVQSMTILGETTGMRAVVTFKPGGMFSGRNEEVSVQMFDKSGDSALKIGLQGRWTESLKRDDNDSTVWKVGSLVSDAPKMYGWTTFAAALNEVTEVEKDQLPPTDTRLRPDQQALENCDYDKAESTKAQLEEKQRGRRKKLESEGQKYKPVFFEQVAGPETKLGGNEHVWLLKQQDGYWDKRSKGDWKGVPDPFEL